MMKKVATMRILQIEEKNSYILYNLLPDIYLFQIRFLYKNVIMKLKIH